MIERELAVDDPFLVIEDDVPNMLITDGICRVTLSTKKLSFFKIDQESFVWPYTTGDYRDNGCVAFLEGASRYP